MQIPTRNTNDKNNVAKMPNNQERRPIFLLARLTILSLTVPGGFWIWLSQEFSGSPKIGRFPSVGRHCHIRWYRSHEPGPIGMQGPADLSDTWSNVVSPQMVCILPTRSAFVIYCLASNPDGDLEITEIAMNVVLLIVVDRLDHCLGGMEATHDRHFTAVFQ